MEFSDYHVFLAMQDLLGSNLEVPIISNYFGSG